MDDEKRRGRGPLRRSPRVAGIRSRDLRRDTANLLRATRRRSCIHERFEPPRERAPQHAIRARALPR